MPIDHSSKQYDLDLEEIRSKVLHMGGLVESQFQEAVRCFQTGNAIDAERVIKADEKVNQLEILLDDACSHLIVRRQPAANDLRMVMATIKVITDLERIGDEATKIARSAKTISERSVILINHYEAVRVIGLGQHVAMEERTVDVHVLRLRRALGNANHLVKTVRSVGYMLSASTASA